MVVKLISQELVQFERDCVSAATPHFSRNDVLHSLLHVTSKIATTTLRHRSVWYSGDKLFGVFLLLAKKIHFHGAGPLLRLESQNAAGRATNDWVVTVVMIRKARMELPLTDMQITSGS